VLTAGELHAGLGHPSAVVRRRAVELAIAFPDVAIVALLDDRDVAEVTAWACGERAAAGLDASVDGEATLERMIALAVEAADPLVRESCVAALGAIGDERALPAILHACADKPAIRRRAVLALAPFDGDDVEAAIERALGDPDWQVRQSAEDLRRATAG
jgi:HEAT repeat protein